MYKYQLKILPDTPEIEPTIMTIESSVPIDPMTLLVGGLLLDGGLGPVVEDNSNLAQLYVENKSCVES